MLNNGMLPGWRDLERAVALAFGGEAQESKCIFDVLVPITDTKHSVGFSCKMRRELGRIARDGRVTIEVSNSAAKFWQRLNRLGVKESNLTSDPARVGAALVALVEEWYEEANEERTNRIDLAASSYLVLSYDHEGWYQFHQFPLGLPNPRRLVWSFPSGKRLIGRDRDGVLIEWYGGSGGQLKYYPFAASCVWLSSRFRLEPLGAVRYGVIEKVQAYFPEKWARVR